MIAYCSSLPPTKSYLLLSIDGSFLNHGLAPLCLWYLVFNSKGSDLPTPRLHTVSSDELQYNKTWGQYAAQATWDFRHQTDQASNRSGIQENPMFCKQSKRCCLLHFLSCDGLDFRHSSTGARCSTTAGSMTFSSNMHGHPCKEWRPCVLTIHWPFKHLRKCSWCLKKRLSPSKLCHTLQLRVIASATSGDRCVRWRKNVQQCPYNSGAIGYMPEDIESSSSWCLSPLSVEAATASCMQCAIHLTTLRHSIYMM